MRPKLTSHRFRWSLLPLSLGCFLATPALAGQTYRAGQPVKVVHNKQAFRAWSIDTGWIPAEGEVQVRVLGDVGAELGAKALGSVELGGEPWKIWAEGDPEGGWLGMNMGVELHTYLRLNLTLSTGQTVQWEGEVPGDFNFDYRFAGQSTFTPFLLTGQEPATAQVSDSIDQAELLSIPLTSAIIPIPGIEGTLTLFAGGALDVLLHGKRVILRQGELTRFGETLSTEIPQDSILRTSIQYEALAEYGGTLVLEPAVMLSVGPASWRLASMEVPVPLSKYQESWMLNPPDGTAEVTFDLRSGSEPTVTPEPGNADTDQPMGDFRTQGCSAAGGASSALLVLLVLATLQVIGLRLQSARALRSARAKSRAGN